jgi:very-short-patch-repair endonuclease
VIVHTRELNRAETTIFDSIPTTTPARTLLDIASVVDEATLELATESTLRKKQTSVQRLRSIIDRESGSGRRGVRPLRTLLDKRDGQKPTESHLETRVARFFGALRSEGIPLPVRQFPIADDIGFIGRVDFAYPDARMALEVLSFQFHSGRESWLRDVKRFNRLHKLGWTVSPLTEEDLEHPPAGLIREIRERLGIATLFNIRHA